MSGMWLDKGYKNGYQKDMCERDWTMCSKHGNHFTFNMQYNRGNLYDHLMSTRIFTLVIRYSYELHNCLLGKWVWPRYGFVNYFVEIVCFMYEEKWARKKKGNHLRPIYLRHD